MASFRPGRVHLILLLLAVLPLAAFHGVARHPFVDFDDHQYIHENPHVREGLSAEGLRRAFTSTRAANWHPLTWISHMADVSLFGLNAGPHHLVNLFIHVANTILLFALLRRMTGAAWRSGFAAALFAVHPLHVESVAWIAERKDLLSALFWLLATWAHVRYAERPGVRRYAWVVVLFIMGLMSKPMVVTLPFVLLLLDFWPLGRLGTAGSGNGAPVRPAGTPLARLLAEKAPLLLLAAVSCAVTLYAQGRALAPLDHVPFGSRLANALVSWTSYLVKTAWPTRLAAYYPHPGALTAAFVAKAVGSAAFLSLVTGLVVRGAGRRPWLAVGWLWYLGTLVPVIGLVQVGGQAMADRYTYIPLIGIFVAAAWGTADIAATWRVRPAVPAAAGAATIVILAVAASLQARHWRSSEALYARALAVTSGNVPAHINLGAALARRGDLDGAIVQYRDALRVDPVSVEALMNLAAALGQQGRFEESLARYREAGRLSPGDPRVHDSLGVTLGLRGRLDEAVLEFRQALRLDPGYGRAHCNLGNALLRQGAVADAIARFREALRINPGDADAYAGLGTALEREGKADDAIASYREAIRNDPDHADAHFSLGNALYARGAADEAIAHLRAAVRARPDHGKARNNLGWALFVKGSVAEAATHFEAALRLDPGDALAHANLGAARFRQGRFEEAASHFRKAVESDGGNVEARYNLGVALRRQGRFSEAAAQFREVLRRAPRHEAALRQLAWSLAGKSG